MEGIPRELKREIARSKPAQYKPRRKSKVMVIDDFGEMKSGNYLRILISFFSVASLCLGLTTAGLYTRCTHQAKACGELTQKISFLEQKARKLTEEKEIYMARLVLSENREDPQAMNISKEKHGDKRTKS